MTKPPPHNPKAERAVLGALLLDPQTIDRTRAILAPNDFYREQHRLIYQTILDMHAEGKQADLVTLHDHFMQHGQLKDVGGLDYLNKLIDDTVTSTRVEQNARIIRRHALSRQAIKVATEAVAGIESGDLDAVSAATSMMAVSRDILGGAGHDDPQTNYARWHKEFRRKLVATDCTFRSTTYPALDDVLSIGFGPGISVWAGRTGCGKTTTFLNICRRLALSGRKVLAFPNETGCDPFMDLMVCAEAGLPHWDVLKRPEIIPDATYVKACTAGESLFKNVIPRPPPIPKESRRWGNPNGPIIDAYVAEILAHDAEIVMVELFQMGFASLDSNDILLALYELRRFIGTANKYHFAIFHHVTQKDEKGKQSKKRPQMKDIRASQGYAESADLVIGLHRPTDPELTKPVIQYEVLKQRDGSPAGAIVQCDFNGPLRLIEGGERIDGRDGMWAGVPTATEGKAEGAV